MRLLLFQFSLLLIVASAFGAGSKVVEGKLEAAPESGEPWILRVGPDAVPVALEKRTRYWLKRAAVDAKAFHPGDAVVARIAPDDSPAALRELADKESWDWLETIRKGVKEGTVKGYDGKMLTVAFADGTQMAYRATEKSKLRLDGKPATLSDLKTGQRLWLKGRTLPTLDVWLVEASDRALAVVAKKSSSKKTKAATIPKLAASGRLDGTIFVHQQGMGMFDLTIDGYTRHVSYFGATAFTFGGVKCGPADLVAGRRAIVTYRRDQYGRINAAKVEIR